jgi:hypothetical protein
METGSGLQQCRRSPAATEKNVPPILAYSPITGTPKC